MWKRRLLGAVQALCGLALILLPILFVRSSNNETTVRPALPVAEAAPMLRYEELVWRSVGKSCSNPPRGQR